MADKMKLDLIGVFSKDRLPVERAPGGYIINLQSEADGDGTHWTYAQIFQTKKGKTALYFDSFGAPCPLEVNKFLMPFKPIAYNNRQIQDLNSQHCGLYCIACCEFFQFVADPKKSVVDNYEDFLNIWSWDTKKNDKILKEFLDKY